jgi:hypothetical protein
LYTKTDAAGLTLVSPGHRTGVSLSQGRSAFFILMYLLKDLKIKEGKDTGRKRGREKGRSEKVCPNHNKHYKPKI